MTRQLMASVAELSIYSAEKFSLSRTIGHQMRVLQEFQSFPSTYDEEEDTTVECQRSPAEDCDKEEQVVSQSSQLVSVVWGSKCMTPKSPEVQALVTSFFESIFHYLKMRRDAIRRSFYWVWGHP